MAFNLQNIIWSLYPKFDTIFDINKISGKGLVQRYNEMVAKDFDLQLLPQLGSILENTLIPSTALQKFFIHIEDSLGIGTISNDLTIRRRFLRNILSYLKVKGTKKGLEAMFQIIGFTPMVLVELFPVYGFDSPVTLDDRDRVFDMTCDGCSEFTIDLDGSFSTPLTVDQINSIFYVIEFNRPINAKLRDLTYQGGDLVNINLTINPNGGFPICVNPYDSELKVELILGVHTVTKTNGRGTYTLTAPNTLNFVI